MRPTSSILLDSLARATAEHPIERKLLLCAAPAQGRELLHALLHAGTAWTGWEAISLRQLAHELAAPALAQAGASVADEFDVLALVDEAIDSVAQRGDMFAGAIAAPGFREAAQAAIRTLRDAGIAPDQLAGEEGDTKLPTLAEVLRAFEAALRREQRDDDAGVLARALEALSSGGAQLPDARIFVMPGLRLDGWAGRLFRRVMEDDRVELLAADPVVGLDAPSGVLHSDPGEDAESLLSYLHAPERLPAGVETGRLHLFAAATPADEVREVLRRILHLGLPWDQVEVVTTDPFTYGPALDSLARRLGIGVTHAAGLPGERTRVGRAVRAYLLWISEGFPSDRLRRLLETGDLVPPSGSEVSGTALARRLRRLRIGWGRERYLEAVSRVRRSVSERRIWEDDDREAAAGRLEREARELRALEEMLTAILTAAPPMPERLRLQPVRVSPAAVAEGLLAFLEFVPGGDEVENVARGEIRRRLERARQMLRRETSSESAIAIVQSRLGLRVAAQEEGLSASWISNGGRLHLSDVANGGCAHRPYVFVVGLDSTRTTGAGGGDPLLSDSDRGRLNARIGGVPALPTTGERIARDRHEMAAMLARLRGEVTFSFSAWDAAEGRSISPAPELLQVLRLRERNPHLTYEDLRRVLGPLACAVPHGESCLDASDVWMRTLAAGRALREGSALVREAFPGLAGGLRAREARAGEELTAFQGRISRETAEALMRDMYFSPSGLETLGTCPRKFLYRHLLGVRPTEDPDWDPDSWLDALERGSLLHAVYEHSLEQARERAIGYGDAAFEALALEVLEEEARAARHRVPPPTERLHALEMEQLRADVRLFVRLVRDTAPSWLELEYEFGGAERPVTVRVDGREVRLRGKIDRVDELAPGQLRVIDYKTGSAHRYRRNRPFAGGRRIQHVVYLRAAAELLEGTPAEMDYSFPTARGENQTVPYPADALRKGETALRALMDLAFAGLFIATEDTRDCKYCDYRTICRVRQDDFGKVISSEAAWSKRVGMESLAEYEPLRTLRGIDD